MAKNVRHDEKLNSYFGEKSFLDVAQSSKFSDLIYELLTEEVPSVEGSKIFEFILNVSIDHGSDTPSAVETINVAKAGKSLSESVTAGLLQINSSHGGAITPTMELFYKINSENLRIADVVKEHLNQDKRIPGFGHRIYEVDPRTQVIWKMLKEASLGEEFISIAQELEKEIEAQKGKKLPCNIDGAIACALCSFGWEPRLGNTVFIIARTPGLCGQYLNNTM